MRSKQYLTSIKNNPHEISTDPIFYFSGTGNSRWVAESLGKRLEDAVEDITDVKIEKKEYTLPEGEILGFVCFEGIARK